MPQLSDLVEKRSEKKFIKKSYRPWDLSGTGIVESEDEAVKTSPAEPLTTTVTETNDVIAPSLEMTSTPSPEVSTLAETGNNQVTEQVTTRQQPGNNQVTDLQVTGNNQVTTRQQPGNRTGNETGNRTGNRTGNKFDAFSLLEEVKKLTGLQKEIFYYIVNICTVRGGHDTGNILTTDIALAADCSLGSAKTSIIRLVEKHLLIRYPGKACRGGHIVLGLTQEIQAAAIQAQQTSAYALPGEGFEPITGNRTGNRTGNETGNRTGNNAYSSSSFIKALTTTSLPEDWKKINLELLEPIGFSETQLCQLFESDKTAPEIVEESIKHFAFGLQHNEKTKTYKDPLNVFMGVLRKGQRWYEADYVSPKELLLRQIVDEKRQTKEKFEALVKELLDIEFPTWRKNLTSEQIQAIVPESILKMNVTQATNSSLRQHFTESIILPRLKAGGLTHE